MIPVLSSNRLLCTDIYIIILQQSTKSENSKEVILKFKGQQFTSIILAITPTPSKTPKVFDVTIDACYSQGNYILHKT